MAFDIDVFIPTLKKRTDNLLCQVHTALNSGLNVRVTISIPDDNYLELIENLTEKELNEIRFITNVPQGNPAIPIKHCLENESWSDWIYCAADDDCILPWGLQHLWNAREGVAMVMGQTLGVSRTNHLDFSSWKIGHSISESHCSTALISMRSLETLPKPWYSISPVCDYLLIRRMAEYFPHKIIPSVTQVQAFAELENLGKEFIDHYKEFYGHLL